MQTIRNWQKFLIVFALLIISFALSYHFLISTPAQQKFDNCLKSYSATYEKALNDDLHLSKADLCSADYSFSQFNDFINETTAAVTKEYKLKYANPLDPWIMEKMRKEIFEKVRGTVLKRGR